ncbi:MAG: PKD domain-containing protein [Desulfobacteraceae bacterium]|nr:PKD domain-containing protein [Desulfobacteraceae bacterium]
MTFTFAHTEETLQLDFSATLIRGILQGISDESWGLDNVKVQLDTSAGLLCNFTADKTTGNAPHTVTFKDQSTGNPTSWQWDFNNDSVIDSTEQNPTFTYDTAGIYSVRLIAENADSEDEEAKMNFIKVGVTLPDLQVTEVQASQAVAGQPLEVIWTITNKGEGATNMPGWYD